MHVGTSKSKEIKKYYIELEKVFKFYLEYQNEYRKYELERKESIINEQKEILDSTIKNTKLDKHKMLIEKFKNKQCIYVIEVNLENELHLIKIGSTKNIYDRISAMNSSYSCECILLDIYECETNYREIEQYILTNKDIKKNLYKEKINNVMPKEIVKLSEYFNYEQLINIIQDSIKTNIYLTPVQLLEKQKMDLVNRLLDNGYNPNLFENFTINIITKHEVELKNNNNCCNQNKINTDEIINNFYKNTTVPENELINEPETKIVNELINESAAESVTEPEIEFNNNFMNIHSRYLLGYFLQLLGQNI